MVVALGCSRQPKPPAVRVQGAEGWQATATRARLHKWITFWTGAERLSDDAEKYYSVAVRLTPPAGGGCLSLAQSELKTSGGASYQIRLAADEAMKLGKDERRFAFIFEIQSAKPGVGGAPGTLERVAALDGVAADARPGRYELREGQRELTLLFFVPPGVAALADKNDAEIVFVPGACPGPLDTDMKIVLGLDRMLNQVP
jgi:hypothetical protein